MCNPPNSPSSPQPQLRKTTFLVAPEACRRGWKASKTFHRSMILLCHICSKTDLQGFSRKTIASLTLPHVLVERETSTLVRIAPFPPFPGGPSSETLLSEEMCGCSRQAESPGSLTSLSCTSCCCLPLLPMLLWDWPSSL